MGWCSATEIMDVALQAAEEAARTVTTLTRRKDGTSAFDLDSAETDLHRDVLDEALSPFVATLATKLRDSDWDCIEESDYFDRFPQEMLGKDDSDYQEYLLDRLRDIGPAEHNFADLVHRLAEVTERLEDE